MVRKSAVGLVLMLMMTTLLTAQADHLIGNIPGRKTISLNGSWRYIIDSYETGFYNYRYKERRQTDPEAYWNTDIPRNSSERKEHGYTNSRTLQVPGDWNSQDKKLLYYEGTIWYKKSFDYKMPPSPGPVFLYFGAVNYRADVYLNGVKLGMHKGGFTAFNFEIPDTLLKRTGNFLVVKVDNRRHANEIPTLNTDWWNYGGITRDVMLVELPRSYIIDYSVHLKRIAGNDSIGGWVRLSGANPGEKIIVEIPELKIKQSYNVENAQVGIAFVARNLQYWSPLTPKRYRVIISSGLDRVEESIGFRSIEASGRQVLLNGQPLFMRGISIHEEIPGGMRRAHSKADALQLLGWAKELGCNMVRLAHYPHNEMMTRMADSLGILVWSEIPVYWTINFSQAEVLDKAKTQLREMITRDRNRSSVIIWSVGNETPVSEIRTEFMRSLLEQARELDDTRLVSAALEVHYDRENNINLIDDPLGKYVDLVSFNEYLGWYVGTPASCRTANWKTIYDKPLFISETGAEALSGYHGGEAVMWTEEYQAWYYREQLAMLDRMPSNFVGISPWLLVDFRSPRRNNPEFQDGWNNKGLFDHSGKKKKAFYLLRAYYNKKASLKN